MVKVVSQKHNPEKLCRPTTRIIHGFSDFVKATLGELETVLIYHERSHQISHKISDPFQKSHTCQNLCMVNRKLGRFHRQMIQLWESREG